MNNIFKIISTILMIILILVLMWVLINYYKDEPVSNISPNIINQSSNINNVIPEKKDDGNNPTILPNNEKEPNNSGVEIGNNGSEDPENGQPNNGQDGENNDPVIITSSEQTSNAEKQEVLTEIDKTLMELLKVVDKVQTVDETRLGIDESEVQP